MVRLTVAALFFTLLAAAPAYAQDETTDTATGDTPAPTSTADVTECVLTCSQQAIDGGSGACTAVTEVECVCTDTAFQAAVAECIASTCPDQAQAATDLQTATCGATETGATSGGTGATTGGGAATTSRATTTRATTSGTGRPSSSGSHSASAAATTTGAAFHAAQIAQGVPLALFGAAVALF